MTVSTWGQFGVTRIWLAHRRKAPFAIMKFLREAHERGVIRQNGMYYQFRHSLLQERLAARSTVPDPAEPLTGSEMPLP
jgi:hypothetical protein